MIVKFSKHGKGKASGVLNYLLKEKEADGRLMPRKHAKVLYGDPVLTEHLIDTTVHKSKYKSGYLSFSERADEISEDDKKRIMREFEQVIFCGLDPDQYDILWVEHADKDIDDNNPVGRLELNFVIPCQELRSGKSFQPYYEPADQRRVNAWKNIVNAEVKTIRGESLSDPNDPKRQRLVNPYNSHAPRPSPFNINNYSKKQSDEDDEIIQHPPSRRDLEEALKRRLLLESQRGIVTNRQSLLTTLRRWGLNVNRSNSETSVSVKHDDLKDKNGRVMSVRLTGGMFAKDYKGVEFEPYIQEIDSSTYYSEFRKTHRSQLDKMNLEEGVKIKTQYHQERYKEAILPEPLAIPKAKVANSVEEVPDSKGTEPTKRYTPSFRR
ncbi:relaxase/mobilization nuclease domain-containing protein [Psychrobacter sanguinis]|uniref:Relaxase/mobilization nuclease domain-containing protein n=1 Tax=Psychrobacter sanguinis TaxID=861445 RepID=A0A844M499_9GAMM|nr:relaxase/mobilization nuclease domain-containing protein [Psychrobacter sanguinis]MUG33457.1 relaxase/mobilization nuclease domain-containing protein [Psychrobacter sanguinis]